MVLGGCTARPAALAPADLPPLVTVDLSPDGPEKMPEAAPPRPAPPPAEPSTRGPERVVLGRSVEGRPLVLHRFSRWGGGTLVIGGIHGNEPTSAEVAERLVALLAADPDGWDDAPVAVLPRANPDGLARGARGNARGVDLNRNFAAQNWTRRNPARSTYGGPEPESEPETRAILEAIAMTAPARIVSIHSISGGRECNNFDGPAEYLARAMSAENGYPVVASLGACRGSLGNWAGVDRDVPIITLELPRNEPGPEAWARNRSALLLAIRPGRAAHRVAGETVESRTETTYHEVDASPVEENTGGR
jgi:predicted deacylase